LAELVTRRYGLREIERAVADTRGGLAARVVGDPRR
jgi:hypothetical protein